MKVLVAHPTGNQNVRAAVSGMVEAGMLLSFHTTLSIFPGDFLDRLGNVKIFSMLRRRRFDRELRAYTKTFPWREVGRLAALQFGASRLVQHESGLFCLDKVYSSFDRSVARSLALYSLKGLSAVYAYEDGAWLTFQRAQQLGLSCFYELPVGYWREGAKIMEEEQQRWPDWAPTLTGLQNSTEKLKRKDRELGLADRIYVASEFTAKTLRSYPGKLPPVQIIPYGFPPVSPQREAGSKNTHRPLRLLFVGGLTQRKGIAYLFEAVKRLKPHVSLTVVGQKTTQKCLVLDQALAEHHWIPGLPHHEILKIMRNHDVLVFPSLFEGFGLVITEAMSQGTPVITTDRTAGPDLIEHGNTGWIIQAGSTESLCQVLEELLERRNTVFEAGCAALETARQRPWDVYAKTLAESIKYLPVPDKVKSGNYVGLPV